LFISLFLIISYILKQYYNYFIFVYFISCCLGGEDLKGARITSIRGTDAILLTSISGSSIENIDKQSYSSLLKQFEHLTIISIPVFADLCTINFQSRATQDLHFFAIYETSTECPNGYLFNEEKKQCQYVDVNKYKKQNNIDMFLKFDL
jgi:hypothetical protein